jgi:MFS family permease
VFAVCGAGFATWAARIPAVQERLGLTAGQLAIALFGLAAGAVLALVVAGPVIARIGSRSGACAGSLLLCLGLAAVAFAPDLPLFVGTLLVLGMGNSLLDVSMNAHAARVEAAYQRPIFAGFHAYWNIGGLAGSGAAALLAGLHVPVTVEFPATGLILLGTCWQAILTRFFRAPDQGQGGGGFVWPRRVLLPLGVIAFCGFIAEGTVNDWSAVYLRGVDAAPVAVASLGYFAFSVAMIAVRLVADRLGTRVGVSRLVRVASLTAFTGFAGLIASTVPAVALVSCAIIGLGAAAIVPLAWSTAARAQPQSPGTAIAAVATMGYLGFLAGPVMIGGLASLIGLRLALCGAAVVVLAVALLARAMAPQRALQ